MNSLKYSFFALASVFTLLSCTPSHETTAGLCESNQNNSVSSNHTSFKLLIDRDTGIASKEEQGSDNADENEYRLYLEDILNSLDRDLTTAVDITTPEEGEPLTEDQTATAVDSLINQFNSVGLNYTLENGKVTSADNPLDFLEYLITSTDDDEKIEAFVDAKKQLANGIDADDDFCAYSNNKIRLNLVEAVEENGETVFNVIRQVFSDLSMIYNPFSRTFDHTLVVADNKADLNSSTTRNQTPFAGAYRAEPDDFKAKGLTPPTDRTIVMNNPELTQRYLFVDDFIEKVGKLELTTFDEFCSEKDSEGNIVKDSDGIAVLVTCEDGIATRPPQHDQCNGDDADDDVTDETDLVQTRTLDLAVDHNDFSGIQRARIETDYYYDYDKEDDDNEHIVQIRFYVSQFNSAILRAYKTTLDESGNPIEVSQDIDIDTPGEDTSFAFNPADLIFNPTGCEQQAVLDELVDIEKLDEDDAGVSLRIVTDPGYDTFRFNDKGKRKDFVPTPMFTYTGTIIPDRQ